MSVDDDFRIRPGRIRSSKAQRARPFAVKGLHRVEVGDGKGGTSQAVLEIRYRRIHVLPPIGKQKRYPTLDLTVIHAKERGAPKGRKPI